MSANECCKKISRKWFVNYVVSMTLLTIAFFHIDVLTEFLQTLHLDTSETTHALAVSIVSGCGGDELCIINNITKWTYENIKINESLGRPSLKTIFMDLSYGFDDILKYGGVCRHKTLVAMSMLKTLGMDCNIQDKVVFNDGIKIGHEWYECKINGTVYVCDPTYFSYCMPKNSS